jgi:hypothetical protein
MPRTSATVGPRLLFRACLRACGGKQAALAHVAEMTTPKVSRILAGEQAIGWGEAVEAAEAVVEALPESRDDIARALALHVAGVTVEPVRLEPDAVGDYRDELDDLDLVQAEMLRCLRAGDRDGTIAAARRLVQEAEEAAMAARLQVVAR